MNILHLPDEMLISVFQHLELDDLLTIRCVCERFKEVASRRCLLKFTIEKEIRLDELQKFLSLRSLTENVFGLTLLGCVGRERFLKNRDHLIPLKQNCPNLTALCLDSVTIKADVSIDDFPPSLISLDLRKVTLESEVNFLCSNRRIGGGSVPTLRELCIDHVDIRLGVLKRFVSLKVLHLLNIDRYDQFRFGDLKGKLPELETLELNFDVRAPKDVMKVVRSFPNLRHFQIHDFSTNSRNVGIDDFRDLHMLETLTVRTCGELVEGTEVPKLPSLKTARFYLWAVGSPRFFVRFPRMFPVLVKLELLAQKQSFDLPVSVLLFLGAHPTLKYLRLSEFRISNSALDNGEEQVLPIPKPFVSGVEVYKMYAMDVANEAAPHVLSCFSNLRQLCVSDTGLCSLDGVFYRDSAIIGAMLQKMEHLERASFAGVFVTDKFVETVVPSLSKRLEVLELDDMYGDLLGDRGLTAVVKNLPYLRQLCVRGRDITDSGVLELSRLTRLLNLSLFTSDSMPSLMLEELKRRLPSLKLTYNKLFM